MKSTNGRYIGKTTSGKFIYDVFEDERHNKFTKEDHLDAFRVHAKIHSETTDVTTYNNAYNQGKKHYYTANNQKL